MGQFCPFISCIRWLVFLPLSLDLEILWGEQQEEQLALTRSQFQFARARSVGMNVVVPSLEGGPSFWQEVPDTFCLWEHSGAPVPGPWWNFPPSTGWLCSALGMGLQKFW